MAWTAPTGWFASLGAATQAVIAQGKLIEVEGKWGASGSETICAGVPARILTASTALTLNWGTARTHIIDNVEGIGVSYSGACASAGLGEIVDIKDTMDDVTEASQDVANGGYYTNIIDHLDTILTWTSPARNCTDVQNALDHIISSLGIQTVQMGTVFDGIYSDVTGLFGSIAGFLAQVSQSIGCASDIYEGLESTGMLSLLGATDSASDSFLLNKSLTWTKQAKLDNTKKLDQITQVYTNIKTEVDMVATLGTAVTDVATMLGTLNNPVGSPAFPT